MDINSYLCNESQPSCLRLSLKTKWFYMTKAGIKIKIIKK